MAEEVYDPRTKVMKEIRDEYSTGPEGTKLPSATTAGGSRGFNVNDLLVPVEIGVDGKPVNQPSQPKTEDPEQHQQGQQEQQQIQHDPVLVKTAEKPVVEAPSVKVVFEFDNAIGSMEAWYHNVTQEGYVLVLQWDTRYKGPRYMPGRIDSSFVVHVGADSYVARSFGINFELERYNLALCVLVVEAADD